MAIQTETLALAKHQLPLDTPEVGNGMEQLISDLKTTHTLPLWAQMENLNPHTPNPSTVPHVWRYDALRPHLLRAGDRLGTFARPRGSLTANRREPRLGSRSATEVVA